MPVAAVHNSHALLIIGGVMAFVVIVIALIAIANELYDFFGGD